MLKDEDISYVLYVYSSSVNKFDKDLEEIDMV